MTSGSANRPSRRLAKTSLPLIIVVSTLIIFASATPVTIRKASVAAYGGALIQAYYENQNPPVTGCTLPCLSVDTQTSQPATSNSFTISRGASAYLWSPAFGSSTAISAGSWELNFWASASSYSYVPVTLTNNQGAQTPSTFQAEVQMIPTNYNGYVGSDLGNIGFCLDNICTTVLYSWLEGCGSAPPYGPCSPTSAVATFWVRLTSPIAANGGKATIYMIFFPTSTEFDGTYRGEAPQLSSTYAAYDNGANVFDLYFNGNTAPATFNGGANNVVAQGTASNPITGGATLHVISLTGYGGGNRVNMILSTPLPSGNPTYGEIAESYSEIQTGSTANVQGLAGFCDSTTAGSGTMNAESEDVGLGGSLYAYIYDANGGPNIVNGGGTDAALTWYYAALGYPGTGSTSFAGIVSTNFYATYAASTQYHPITGSAHLYWCSVGSSSTNYPDGLYFNWGRARAYPPGNVQPSPGFGTLTTSTFPSSTFSVSIYVTNSGGTGSISVATNIQSPLLGTTESEYTMSPGGSQVTVPANGYISIVLTSASTACTVYWGTGQPTDFQVSTTYRST